MRPSRPSNQLNAFIASVNAWGKVGRINVDVGGTLIGAGTAIISVL